MAVSFQKTLDLEGWMYAKALVSEDPRFGSDGNKITIFATLKCSICCDVFWQENVNEAKK